MMDVPQASSSCKVILAGTVAKGVMVECRETLDILSRSPHLIGFLANSDPAARQYADWSKRTCEENGIEFELVVVEKEVLEEHIIRANADTKIDGIIIYYPIYNSRQDHYIQQLVELHKDVEGLSHQYIFNMYQNVRFLDYPYNHRKSILPCTPLAIVKILEFLKVYSATLPEGNRMFGRIVTVINRSEVVGRPLAALLANDGACVYSVDLDGIQQFTRSCGGYTTRHDVHTKLDWTLKDCLPISDVVISGVPGDNFKVPTELIREGAVCINFSSEKNFVGEEVKQKASVYVPSIGKVTIAILIRNLLRLILNREDPRDYLDLVAMDRLVVAYMEADVKP